MKSAISIAGAKGLRRSMLARLFALVCALVLVTGGVGCASESASESGTPAQAPFKAAEVVEDASQGDVSDRAPGDVAASSPTSNPSAFSIPTYTGEDHVECNGGIPTFTAEDLARSTFEEYAPLDQYGRATGAFALVSDETRPAANESRPSISSVHPSGWHKTNYAEVNGGSLYNRSHLIAWSLSAEGANPGNLITGTTHMNQVVMQRFENEIRNYISNTGNHVLMRVTPVYEGANLVATGVHYEAQSIEDGGQAIRFNAFMWNIQPGIGIDYATGESWVEEASSASAQALPDTSPGYILNTRSKKFHYPDCPSVAKMKDTNKHPSSLSREELIAQGYTPCGNCNP